jgi:hypothetical protein
MVKNLCMENSVIKLHLLSTVYYRKGWRKSQAFLSLKKKGRVFCRKRSFRPILPAAAVRLIRFLHGLSHHLFSYRFYRHGNAVCGAEAPPASEKRRP